jgi:hypothetical protein
MPHDSNVDLSRGILDTSGCPPRCPYLLWFREHAPATTRDAAFKFMDECGLVPTPDAVDQLIEAFLPALAIMCERGYAPNGATWRASGWRGQLYEVRKIVGRLWFHSWQQRNFKPDSAIDGINYLGFYLRLQGHGLPWGELGEPDELEEK